MKKIERVLDFTCRLFNSHVDQANAHTPDSPGCKPHDTAAAALHSVIVMIESTYCLESAELEGDEAPVQDEEIRVGDAVRFRAYLVYGGRKCYAAGTGIVEAVEDDTYYVRQERIDIRDSVLHHDETVIVSPLEPYFDTIEKI